MAAYVDDELTPEGISEEKPLEGMEKPEILAENLVAEVLTSFQVSATTPIEVVSRKDNEGVVLVFSEDDFQELPVKVVESLSRTNKERYFLTLGAFRYLAEKRKFAGLPDLGIVAAGASATQQLDVDGKDPSMHYVWKRPDELQKCLRDGYVTCTEEEVVTFSPRGSSIHTVGVMGNTELILMKIPQERYDADQRDQAERKRLRDEGMEQQAREEISKIGPLYDPKGAKRDHPFTVIGKADE